MAGTDCRRRPSARGPWTQEGARGAAGRGPARERAWGRGARSSSGETSTGARAPVNDGRGGERPCGGRKARERGVNGAAPRGKEDGELREARGGPGRPESTTRAGGWRKKKARFAGSGGPRRRVSARGEGVDGGEPAGQVGAGRNRRWPRRRRARAHGGARAHTGRGEGDRSEERR